MVPMRGTPDIPHGAYPFVSHPCKETPGFSAWRFRVALEQARNLPVLVLVRAKSAPFQIPPNGEILHSAPLLFLSVSHPRSWAAKRFQNNPVIFPFSSTSIFSAAGTLGRPGMVPRAAGPHGDPCDLTQIVRSEFGRFQDFRLRRKYLYAGLPAPPLQGRALPLCPDRRVP